MGGNLFICHRFKRIVKPWYQSVIGIWKIFGYISISVGVQITSNLKSMMPCFDNIVNMLTDILAKMFTIDNSFGLV